MLPRCAHLDDDGTLVEIASLSSHATADRKSGLGCTLDKFLVLGGRTVERLFTWIWIQTGRGPYLPITEIANALFAAASVRCSSCDVAPASAYLPPNAKNLQELYEWLFRVVHDAPCSSCHEYRKSVTIDSVAAYRKLIKFLASSNETSRSISLQFITIIALCSEHAREALIELDIRQSLSDLADDADCYFEPELRSASLRALAVVSDNKIFDLGSQIKRLSLHHNCEQLTGILDKLVAYSKRTTDERILALTVIRRSILMEYILTIEPLDSRYIFALCEWVTEPTDGVELAVLTDFLCAVFQYARLDV